MKFLPALASLTNCIISCASLLPSYSIPFLLPLGYSKMVGKPSGSTPGTSFATPSICATIMSGSSASFSATCA